MCVTFVFLIAFRRILTGGQTPLLVSSFSGNERVGELEGLQLIEGSFVLIA